MVYLSLVRQAQQYVAQIVRPGDTVIDATVGNGYDTVFLANAVGDTGKVFGFDIQSYAIENTQQKLLAQNLQHRVCLLLQNHGELGRFLPPQAAGRIKGAMFNLGYLPGGDKSVVTRPDSTLQALQDILQNLLPGGIVTIVAYRGHAGGDAEAKAVKEWLTKLDKTRFLLTTITADTQSTTAPLLLIIRSVL